MLFCSILETLKVNPVKSVFIMSNLSRSHNYLSLGGNIIPKAKISSVIDMLGVHLDRKLVDTHEINK